MRYLKEEGEGCILLSLTDQKSWSSVTSLESCEIRGYTLRELSSQSASLHSRSTPSRASCQLRIDASYKKARTGVLTLPHGDVPLPVFMPVGTQGTIKGLTSEQVAEQGCKIILGNTYHLGTRPGTDLLARMGGLHEFMKWPHNMLTDSGGFQMVSLLDLATITEEGVLFRSPVDGSKMMLTPEESMRHQNNIGADVMMVLDDVCSSLETNRARVQEASERSIRWLDRCISAHARPDRQNLFGIVQGGLDPKLRRINLGEMLKRDRDLPGYAIGGLAGGEDKAQFWRVVHQCTSILPPNKPRYCMGVGYPLDLVVCVALGVDMFDCVWPCRTARFGTAIVPEGLLQLKRAQYKEDSAPISRECDCLTCRKYTRAYLHSVATKETVACHLLSIHNIRYQMNLMRDMGQALRDGTFPAFVRRFLHRQFPRLDWPEWVQEALSAAQIDTGRKTSYSVEEDPYFQAAQPIQLD
eukprot:g38577.t1